MLDALTIAAASATPDPARVRNAFSLLLMLALLGVVLITCLTLILWLRRHRLAPSSRRQRAAGPPLDPWHEAGRRLIPPDDTDADPELGPPAS
ncbi:MAG: hypothetical protein R3B57_11520 [Phycisphaerales bacterium]